MPEQLYFSNLLLPGDKDSWVSVNREMLILAREAKGYSQKELAREMDCHQSRLSKMEAGTLFANSNDIEKLSKILEQEPGFFSQHEPARPSSVSFYRKGQTLALKVLRQCNAQMNVRRLQIERRVGTRKIGVRQLPGFPAEVDSRAELIAQKLRNLWGIPSGPVENITKLIEDSGCVIVEHEFPSPRLDGVSFRNGSKFPIIFLNSALSKSRRRLTLAHELGHLIMHVNPHENVEQQAWDFAAEFMMPSTEIGTALSDLDLDKLGRLKTRWGISMQALLQRARKLNKISESHHRYLWIQIGKCGYRTHEPFEDLMPEEKPTKLEERLAMKN